ncbi:MAG: helix-turn-helix domain-containing protein [Micrococcaceae bacterium]
MSKQQILDTAIQLFTEEGYDKVSMREIAEAAGMTKPALYYHFKSKEDFVRTYLQDFMKHQEDMLHWVENAQGVSSTEFIERMAKFAENQKPETIAFILRNYRIVKEVTSQDFEEAKTSGKLLRAIVAKEWGLAKPNLAVEVRVRAVIATIFNLMSNSHVKGKREDIFNEVLNAALLLVKKPNGK